MRLLRKCVISGKLVRYEHLDYKEGKASTALDVSNATAETVNATIASLNH